MVAISNNLLPRILRLVGPRVNDDGRLTCCTSNTEQFAFGDITPPAPVPVSRQHRWLCHCRRSGTVIIINENGIPRLFVFLWLVGFSSVACSNNCFQSHYTWWSILWSPSIQWGSTIMNRLNHIIYDDPHQDVGLDGPFFLDSPLDSNWNDGCSWLNSIILFSSALWINCLTIIVYDHLCKVCINSIYRIYGSSSNLWWLTSSIIILSHLPSDLNEFRCMHREHMNHLISSNTGLDEVLLSPCAILPFDLR